MQTILVTGSSGTIGTRFCETLMKQGRDVIAVDWRKNKWQPSVDAITRIVDLRDQKAVQELGKALKAEGKKIDVIMHLAANARVYELVEEPDMARDNVLTIYNMLELARALDIKRFVFPSSRETYGNARHERYTEDLVRVEHCESPYTASKIAGEAFVHSYARCYGLETMMFRFSNVYGMYDDSDRVLPLFIRLAGKNETLTVFGKDKCLDFTYIDDNVDGMLLALKHWDKAKGRTFNLGNGEGTTILQLAESILKLTGATSTIVLADSRRGEVTHYIADITQAKTVLGYNPQVKFAEGVQKTVEWYAKNA
jgi:nucleoside-diphosphate-sugar epimerase